MNPFKREQHLEQEHEEALASSDHPNDMDSDESRALHRYFHERDFIRPTHDHPENDY